MMTSEPAVKDEILRRKSQTQKILEKLQDGEQTNVVLQRIAFNYTMRISELRKEGHVIVASYVKPGVYRYTYLGNKNDDDTNVNEID
jgi:hypothetical protein